MHTITIASGMAMLMSAAACAQDMHQPRISDLEARVRQNPPRWDGRADTVSGYLLHSPYLLPSRQWIITEIRNTTSFTRKPGGTEVNAAVIAINVDSGRVRECSCPGTGNRSADVLMRDSFPLAATRCGIAIRSTIATRRKSVYGQHIESLWDWCVEDDKVRPISKTITATDEWADIARIWCLLDMSRCKVCWSTGQNVSRAKCVEIADRDTKRRTTLFWKTGATSVLERELMPDIFGAIDYSWIAAGSHPLSLLVFRNVTAADGRRVVDIVECDVRASSGFGWSLDRKQILHDVGINPQIVVPVSDLGLSNPALPIIIYGQSAVNYVAILDTRTGKIAQKCELPGLTYPIPVVGPGSKWLVYAKGEVTNRTFVLMDLESGRAVSEFDAATYPLGAPFGITSRLTVLVGTPNKIVELDPNDGWRERQIFRLDEHSERND